MSQSESTVLSLLSGIEFDDTRLYALLDQLVRDFYALDRQVNPPSSTSQGVSGIQIPSTSAITGFTVTLFEDNVRLTWDSISQIIVNFYEVRYKVGINTPGDWDTANIILRTATTTANINPISIPMLYGNHTFFIKAVDNSGLPSGTASVVIVNIPQIPAVVITATVIDNNVLLKWTTPASTFRIRHYNVYKGGVQQGDMDGTFEAIFETAAGTYTYTVEAEDIVGNLSTIGSITLQVNKPPDFELTSNLISGLTGTKVNVLKVDNYLICNLDLTKTWTTHFTSRSWTDPQDQITAGYPIFCQPTLLTGSYEEVIDYGLVINNTIVSIAYSAVQLAGSTAIVTKIATSLDNITYSAFVFGTSQFIPTLRYVKIRFEFTSTNDTGLLIFSNINTRLDVKREMDSGSILALASSGATGTEVLFNKVFKDIDSITLSVAAIQPITAIYAFVDIPNPIHFYVFAFDSSGNRVDYLISWKARGIV